MILPSLVTFSFTQEIDLFGFLNLFFYGFKCLSVMDERNDWTSMAVSLSTNIVKLYSPETGQFYGECKGHSSTLNHISFLGPSTPHVLHSCSSDGTIRAWDTRTYQQVGLLSSYAYSHA